MQQINTSSTHEIKVKFIVVILFFYVHTVHFYCLIFIICTHILSILITLENTIYKVPEDGAEAPKHVEAFVT